jgi:hypothetical protein
MYEVVMTEKAVKALRKMPLISEKNKPRFEVLPFGDEEAEQDYLDELWADKAVAEFQKTRHKKLYSLAEVKRNLNL